MRLIWVIFFLLPFSAYAQNNGRDCANLLSHGPKDSIVKAVSDATKADNSFINFSLAPGGWNLKGGDIPYILREDSDIKKAVVSTRREGQLLQIPTGEIPRRETILRWLAGHPLHPYIANATGPQSVSVLRPGQSEAVESFSKAMEEGVGSFLFVAPTAYGKTWVLSESVEIQSQNSPKISLVISPFIKTVDQVAESLEFQLKRGIVLNRNERESFENKPFAAIVKNALGREHPTVIAMTNASFVQQLKTLSSEEFSLLAANLNGIYADEAHRLGAPATLGSVQNLLEAGDSILFGVTATPVHSNTPILELFERTVAPGIDKSELEIRDVLTQLRKAIDTGEIAPFDDIYVLGETTFKDARFGEDFAGSVFVQNKSMRFELNERLYGRLAKMIEPIVKSNQKGFLVTATIAEAERMAEFLGEFFAETGTTFEAYHSNLSSTKRAEILENSHSHGRHFLVAVRALDEGVNLPHLSAYIDLNVNVSVKQMVHRIGRVLRHFEGKRSVDIAFLADYKNAETSEALLELLDHISKRPSSGVLTPPRRRGEVAKVEQSSLVPARESFSRDNLRDATQLLRETAVRYWSERGPSLRNGIFRKYKVVQAHVQALGIKTQREYYKLRKEGKLPADFPGRPDKFYEEWESWTDFLGTGRKRPRKHTDEFRREVAEYGIKHGCTAAAIKFNVNRESVRKWAIRFEGAQRKNKIHTDEFRREVAEYGIKHGYTAAARKFNVNRDSVRKWAIIFGGVQPKKRRSYTDEEITEALDLVEESSYRAASVQLNIPVHTIFRWAAAKKKTAESERQPSGF